jgi:tartrate-resistant acid phosphatase type 5
LITGAFWLNYTNNPILGTPAVQHSAKMKTRCKIVILLFVTLHLISCEEGMIKENPPFVMPGDSVRFAVIGDYGKSGSREFQVAELVKSWNPDFIITTGDNNYEEGLLSMAEENIGQYYGDYIYNHDAPKDLRCNGKAFDDGVNRFFPTPGNHDYYGNNSLTPYLTYFTLPGNERYYEFVWGPVHLFSVNSMEHLDGASFAEQKEWFTERIQLSEAPFKIAYFHHPPYSTGKHGNHETMQWNFWELGITSVIAGHDHHYARIHKKNEPGLIYLVNGAGGKSLYPCQENPLNPDNFDVVCYDENYGAMLITATRDRMTCMFSSIDEQDPLIDSCTIELQ